MGGSFENQARQAIKAKNFTALRRICDAAIQAGQTTPQLMIWSANLDRESGDFLRAADAYRQALKRLPKNFPGWFNLGLCLMELKAFPEAGQAFQKSLSRPGGHRPSLLQLGAVLTTMGRDSDVRKLYAMGKSRGLLKHTAQRPAFVCPGIPAKPWWSVNNVPGLADMDASAIAAEVKALMSTQHVGTWTSPALGQGEWQKLFFGFRGRLNPEMDRLCPRTMEGLRRVELATDLPEGNLCASILQPGTEVTPHCGPTNIRLRAHLGLDVPEDCGLNVAGETRAWRNGEWLVFDDSFEHSAWNRSSRPRMILIVDVWHPALNTPEKRQRALRAVPHGLPDR